ncbi:UNVERIFIED_ORG: hypothetical protein J2W85_000180 [Ensifer adhaerens]|nr:hypothetical protein [Ensifer adhaerens]
MALVRGAKTGEIFGGTAMAHQCDILSLGA